jgi:hypothetical protein
MPPFPFLQYGSTVQYSRPQSKETCNVKHRKLRSRGAEPVSPGPPGFRLDFCKFSLPCYRHDPSPVLRTVRCFTRKLVRSCLCICSYSLSAGCSTLRVGVTHCGFCWTERKQCTPLHIPVCFEWLTFVCQGKYTVTLIPGDGKAESGYGVNCRRTMTIVRNRP